jgi:hypothetical protein
MDQAELRKWRLLRDNMAVVTGIIFRRNLNPRAAV